MLLTIINYLVRSALIVIGVFLLFFYHPVNPNVDMSLVHMMGGLMTLFGIYRLIYFYFKSKKYKKIEQEEAEEQNDLSDDNFKNN